MAEPVNSEQSQTSQTPENTSDSRKKALILAILILVGIAGLAIITLRTQKETKQVTQQQDVLLASVGDTKIYRSTVVAIAEEQYLSSAVTNDVIKQFLDTAVERAILDREVEEQELKIPAQASKIDYYNLVKENVIQEQTESADIFVISYWVPPPSEYPDRQLPEFPEQRRVGALAMTEAETRLNAGEEPLAVARSLYTKYTILQATWALNGYLLKSSTDEVLESPKTYMYDPRNEGQQLQDTIFSLSEGEIRKVIWPDESGGAVFKTIKVNKAEKQNYSQWLEEKKKELVDYK
jgi:hypothetical protein